MIRIVLDTDVMVAAFESAHGASRRLLLAALDGEIRPLLSTPLMVEYEAVLTRPSVLERCGLGVAEIISVLDAICAVAIPVGFDYRWRPAAADPDDDHVLETAVNGIADMIATFNLKDLAAAAARFGIPALRPGEVLRRISA